MIGEDRLGPGPGPTLGDGHGLEQLVDGVVVDGRYRIVGRLGRGGMAVVFEVADEMLDGARRALKVLDPELILDREPSEREWLVARFKREVILGQERLLHPNIVRVYGYGRVGEGPLALHYSVHELVVGETLHDWLKGRDELTAEARWALLSQLAGVLAFAHKQGVVHRDVKPSNIFVEPAGESEGGLRLRLGDFGIARILGQPTATGNGATPRTTFHCAPEQVRGDEVGAFTDVYLFGLVAYWLIHDGARWWDPNHSDNPFPDSTGRDLAELVSQCLRSNGSDRPQSGDTLLHLLQATQRPMEDAPLAVPARPELAVAVAGVGKAEPPWGARGRRNAGEAHRRVAPAGRIWRGPCLCGGGTGNPDRKVWQADC